MHRVKYPNIHDRYSIHIYLSSVEILRETTGINRFLSAYSKNKQSSPEATRTRSLMCMMYFVCIVKTLWSYSRGILMLLCNTDTIVQHSAKQKVHWAVKQEKWIFLQLNDNSSDHISGETKPLAAPAPDTKVTSDVSNNNNNKLVTPEKQTTKMSEEESANQKPVTRPISGQSDQFRARAVADLVQKNFANKILSNKTVVKSLIDDSSASLLDNLYFLLLVFVSSWLLVA